MKTCQYVMGDYTPSWRATEYCGRPATHVLDGDPLHKNGWYLCKFHVRFVNKNRARRKMPLARELSE